MNEELKKYKEWFETTSVKYNSLHYGLDCLIKDILRELRNEDKSRVIDIRSGVCACRHKTTLHILIIHNIHFNERGTFLECIDEDNAVYNFHINDVKFNLDEKYNFLKTIMKGVEL